MGEEVAVIIRCNKLLLRIPPMIHCLDQHLIEWKFMVGDIDRTPGPGSEGKRKNKISSSLVPKMSFVLPLKLPGH